MKLRAKQKKFNLIRRTLSIFGCLDKNKQNTNFGLLMETELRKLISLKRGLLL